jgi:hypothetical protein
MNKIIQMAEEAHERTGKELCRLVAEIYPVGEIIHVEKGRSSMMVKVTSHSTFWWSRPGEISGENIATGKKRHFHASDVTDLSDGDN